MRYSKSPYITEYADERASRHPMLIHGAGIATIVAVCTSAGNALCLSLIMLVLCVAMAAVYLFERDEYIQPMRTIVYFVPSSIITFLCGWLLTRIAPHTAADLGAYIPLLAADAVVLARLEEDAPFVPLTHALPEAIGLWWLYAVTALPIGMLRELLAKGSVFGYTLIKSLSIDAAAYPFAGFIMLGFGLAVVQAMHKDKQ